MLQQQVSVGYSAFSLGKLCPKPLPEPSVHPVPETPATPVLEASVTDEPNVHSAGDVPPDNVSMDPVSMSPDSMTSRLTTPSPAAPQTASSRPKRQ